MRKDERQKFILKEINLHNKVLCADLSLQLKVSDDTIRRDITELAETGKVVKVHGGAVGPSFISPFSGQNEVYALESKKIIAEKALRLIKNNSTVLTEGGTTILELAKMIPKSMKATFFTISPQIAITLSEFDNIEVITIGGRLLKNANLHVGSGMINQLSEIKADLCLLGANAFSVEEGLTDLDWEVVQAKKALIRSAKKVVVVTISEKLNTVQTIKICDVNQVNYLITELEPGDPSLIKYQDTNLRLL
ncbi:DeoR/GlpR family DNA-binding transcription regulator [Niabella hirudinis]|uniref:DeoR/GlpR family DNA-binding transcription regulator n=1 Tax=Niabella hirudinis TaxID=1285929 RepID=UPI003EBDDCDC